MDDKVKNILGVVFLTIAFLFGFIGYFYYVSISIPVQLSPGEFVSSNVFSDWIFVGLLFLVVVFLIGAIVLFLKKEHEKNYSSKN